MAVAGEEREMDSQRSATQVRLSRRVRDAYYWVVDSTIPVHLREGNPDELRRARTIIGFTFVLILLGFETLAYFHTVLPLETATLVEGAFGIALLITAAIPWTMQRGYPLEVAANLLIGSSYAVIATILVAFGGINAPLLHWCALPPMLAVLMGARRSSWFWAGAGFLTLVVLVGLEATGGGPLGYFDISELEGPALWAQRAVDLGSWLIILLTISFLYERHKDEQTLELAITNRELVHEIAQRELAEERTRYLAYYDELTTLPNRQLFKEQLVRAMEHAERDNRLLALFFLDLDGFKEINDSHGHEFGDRLLQHVARRLLHCVRAVDSVGRVIDEARARDPKPGESNLHASDAEIVSRLGGDEFTLLLDGIKNFNEAALIARRVIDSLTEPVMLGDQEVYITASIGIALFPGTVKSMDELLRNADLAMYHAKSSGRNNFQFFDSSMNDRLAERSSLVNDLRRALERDELEIDYQPILDARHRAGVGARDLETINSASTRVLGLEALVRWRHPERGRVMPDQFIAIAEESGLITGVGEWVLYEACRQYTKWKSQGIAPERISVNVSGMQLRSQRLAGAVLGALQETGMDPGNLELEITENAMMVDEDEAARCLHLLSDQGVRIAFDDFGTGYSSLSHIKRFPVDVIKIDRSFVGHIESDPEAQAISTAIIAMAHRLGLRVVAEGVETREQENFLREHDCDELQGYLYSRPIAPDKATQFLLDSHCAPEPASR